MQNLHIKSAVKATLLFSLLISYSIFCQESDRLTVEWIYGPERRQVTALPSFTWLSDETLVLLDNSQPESLRTFERFYPKSGQRIPMLDRERALESLRTLLGEDAPKSVRFPDEFDAIGRQALYVINGDIFLLDLKSAQFEQITKTATEEKSVHFSPDGAMLAFVRDNDLFVYDLKNKSEKRLTNDGSETLLNGTLSWVYWEEIFGRQDIGYWWSDDSKAIAYLQTDESPVSVVHFVDFKPNVPSLLKQRYPKAGGKNPVVRVGVIEIDAPKTTRVDLADSCYEYIIRIKWLPDNKRFSLQTMNRDQTKLDLYFVDRYTGKAAHILTETDPGWVNIHNDLYFLKTSPHFIWASERDGYDHLYRFSMDGKLINQITKGDWSVHASSGIYWVGQAVVAIDEKHETVYFTAMEKSPIERHLYRIKFDGSRMQRLTQEDGVHVISFSPGQKFYLDQHSSVSQLPTLKLYKSTGKLVKELGHSKPEMIAKFQIQTPELFTIPAKDGFPLPAWLLKPSDFDPNKKYPIILEVYGGPSAPTVVNSWSSSIYYDQILVDHGFLVAKVDNRSATGISKKLENTILYNASGEGELNDLIDAVKWFKSQSWIDPERVGIWGWSGGGSFTLNAMTHSKEFKAGIAVAAVTDWHYYDSKWAEATMKRPEDNPEGYERTSFVKSAKDLSGRLLLVHGTYDDNVHIQNAWAFADELIKAGKMFDMMIYPMRQHGISDRPARIHLYKTMLEFWLKNL
ncbi:MAG: S9 family peptidase [candidate division KSB1 bacterium]|nr:S9 family peptidase [candidate division KSB1 bacterium]